MSGQNYENVENLNLNAFRPKNMLMSVKKIEKFLNKPMPKIDDGINDLISNGVDEVRRVGNHQPRRTNIALLLFNR